MLIGCSVLAKQSASIQTNWQTSTPTRQLKSANHWAPSASQQTSKPRRCQQASIANQNNTQKPAHQQAKSASQQEITKPTKPASQQPCHHKPHSWKLSGSSLPNDSFPNSSLARKSSPNEPQIIRKQTKCERKSFPNPPNIIYCEQVVAVNLIKGDMHENQPTP